jgi:hypothetical protein
MAEQVKADKTIWTNCMPGPRELAEGRMRTIFWYSLRKLLGQPLLAWSMAFYALLSEPCCHFRPARYRGLAHGAKNTLGAFTPGSCLTFGITDWHWCLRRR